LDKEKEMEDKNIFDNANAKNIELILSAASDENVERNTHGYYGKKKV